MPSFSADLSWRYLKSSWRTSITPDWQGARFVFKRMESLNRDLILASLSVGVEDRETDAGVLTAAGPLEIKMLTRVFQLFNAATEHTWNKEAGHNTSNAVEAVDPKFVRLAIAVTQSAVGEELSTLRRIHERTNTACKHDSPGLI
jgi:hypothetical protein